MSVSASILRMLISADMGNAEFIVVAEAMERGPDRDFIYKLINKMQSVECPDAAVGVAVLEVARQINDVNSKPVFRRSRDGHTSAKDSNRSRRGMPDHKWRALRQEIFERDGFICSYCGSADDLTCDHIVPLARDGCNDPGNLATACRSCNSSKGDKLLEEWQRGN